ncbi:hypothetical protein C0989_008939, partial [Termitomyces sp. Mn162]
CVELPSHWYDPAALPGPPILMFAAPDLHTCSNREKSVQWWNKHTPTVVGVFSPTLSQDVQLQGDSLCQDAELKGDSLHPVYGFNLQTGNSYLPDCSGDISWDTIRCSTEEGGDINGFTSSSSSATIVTLKSGNFSDYRSSNASDSNLSMVITDVDHEEPFHFPAAQSLEGSEKENDLVATALALELLYMEEEHDEDIPFGDGFPPRRASTITRLVGDAIRIRRLRSRLTLVDNISCAETSINPYRCGRSRRYIPHILTTIMEDKDED